MIRLGRPLALFFLIAALPLAAPAQKPTPASTGSEASELRNLSKKIDEQNTKIDLLSQQILRLQQELEHGAAASGHEHASTSPAEATAPVPADANTHVVARGETLTSIARQHHVTIDELQKLNHIENDRNLQIGQTLVLPSAPAATAVTATPAPSATVPNE